MEPVRIEPQLLSVPDMLRTHGEPRLGNIPNVAPRVPLGIGGGGGAGGAGLSMAQALAWGPALMSGLLRAGGTDQVPGQSPPQPEPNVQRASGVIRRPQAPAPAAEEAFGPAFAKARKAGLDEFTWRGKRYHTRLA